MTDISIDYLLTKAANKFLLTNAIAYRTKQISEGSLPYIDKFDPDMPLDTAIREIALDKFKLKILAPPIKPKERTQQRVKEKLSFGGLEKVEKKKKYLVKKKKK